MAIGRISGPLLKANLLRDGVDLAFETDLLYLDVTNGRIGIKNASPSYELDVTGTVQSTTLRTGQAIVDNVEIDGSSITTSVGDLNIDPATVTDRVNIGPATIPNIYGNVLVDGTLTATGDIIANGDIVLGNETTDSVSFVADVDSNIIPNIDDTYNLGSGAQRWLEGHFRDLFVDGVAINTPGGGTVPLLSDEVKKIYVHLGGSDTNGDGENTATAFRTIKHALGQAASGDAIVISPGEYEEEFPLTIPAGVSVNGAGIRATTIKPTLATRDLDAFYLNGETTVQNLSILDMLYNSGNDTGYAFQYAPGATVTRRSPYIKEVSVLNRGSVVTADDPFGFAQGDAGRGIKIDGALLAPGSLEAAMLFNAVTFIVPNSVGLELTNGARVEWLNSFVYFADIGIDAYEGTQGKFGAGKTYVELSGITGTIAAEDIGTFTSTDGSTVVTVTVESVAGDTIAIDGRIDDFEDFDLTPQSISFAPSGATASSIVRYDRKDFGAEMRSISSANVYGNRGVRATGADVRLRLSSHDFGYIGSGGDFSNNDNLVNTANQVIELDQGRVFYSATDQYGDYRIGDLFLVDQDTGAVTFTGGQFDVSSLTGITFTDGSNVTIVDPTKVETGNIRISGNTIESLSSNITISAFNNEVVVSSNQTVNGTLDVTGQSTLASVAVEDLTDNRIVIAGTNGEIEDDANFTFDGTTFNIGATGELTVDVATGNTQVKGTLDVDGQATLASANIEDLTTDRIVVVGTNGELEDDANFTWDGTTLAVTGDQTLSGTLDVDTSATIASLNVEDLTSGRVVLAGTDGEIEDSANLTFDGTLLTVTGNVSVTGTLDVDTSVTIASLNVEDLTDNRIVIAGANGELEDDSNFKFDGTTFTVGVLDEFTVDVVTGNTQIKGTLDVDDQATFVSAMVEDLTSGRVVLAGTNGELEDSNNLTFDGTLLTVTGNTTVTGTLDVDTDATIATLVVEDLTDNRIVIAGTGGEIEDDANFRFDGTSFLIGPNLSETFTVEAATGNTDIQGTLDVLGRTILSSAAVEDLTSGRVVIAGTDGELEDSTNLTFDGTDLTVSSLIVSDLTANRVVLAGTSGAIEDSANLTFNGTTLAVTGDQTVTGTLDVDGQATVASLNVEDLTNGRVVLAGTTGEIEDSANLTFDGSTLTVTGDAQIDDINIDGSTISSSTNIVIDPAAVGDATGTVTIAGDLVVQGVTTTIDSTTVTLEDPIITLGGDSAPIVDDGKDRGVEFRWHTGVDAKVGFFGYDNSEQAFTFIPDATNTSEIFSGATGKIIVGDVQVASLTQNRIAIVGTNGLLTDDADFTWNGTNFSVTGNSLLSGNVTLGSVNTDNITFSGDVASNIIPDAANTYDLGEVGKEWNSIYANALATVELQGGNIKISSNIIENVVQDEGIVIRPNGTGTVDLDTASAVKLPTGGAAERPVIPDEGQVRYNSDSQRVENYNSETWISLATEDDAIAFAIALG